MASIITATTTSGLTQSADNSGVLQLASGTGNLVTVPSVTGTAMVSGNMPAFLVTMSGSQTIPTSTDTKLQFNTEVFDTNNNFDSTTNYRFTPTVAGYYIITAVVNTAFSSASGISYLAIFKNGSSYCQVGRAINSTTGSLVLSGSIVIYFNGSTDYVEVYGFQNTGSSQPFGASSTANSSFSGSLLRSA